MSLSISPRRSTHLLKIFQISCRSTSSDAPLSLDQCQIPTPKHQQHTHFLYFNPRSVSSEIYSSNLKITSLGRCQKVEEARKLFEEMPHHDVVSYASMITLYLRNGDIFRAEKLFHQIPERSVVVESAMIDGYAKAWRIDEARRVFDEMRERNVVSWTSLIAGYLRVGQVGEARKLFDRMPVKNVVSWTTMFLGYARNGQIAEANDIFNQMPEKNIVACTAMIKAYVENSRIDEARKLFDEMPQRNLYSWNIIILGYLDDNRVSEAIQLFESMPHRNSVSWTTMVTGLARNGSIEKAAKFFHQMPLKDVAAYNAMITAYADNGNMIEASKLFNSMTDRNVVSWNAIIDGYADNGPCKEAFRHLIYMLETSTKPNKSTLASTLTSCQSMIEVAQAHGIIILLGFESSTLLTNALITTYSRVGDPESARLAFERLAAKDIVSWTAMILAYATHGDGACALGVFARTIRSGAMPDEITFVGVLSACTHTGLVEKGKKIFHSMTRAYGLEPRAEHYACLVDLFGRAGLVEEAKRVVNQMPPAQRDAPVLASLLGACKLHGDVQLASQVGEELIEQTPDSCGGYVQLANVYAAHGKWDEVARVRKKMKENNLKKFAGYSEIEVKKRSHVFYVGDRRHPQAKQIHAMLDEQLLPLMKNMGYTCG